MKITVSVSALRATLTHSADKDIRYYLCGVYLDCRVGRIVATDGHRLFIGDMDAPADMDSFIVGNADAERIVKACGTGRNIVSCSVSFGITKTDNKVWVTAELQDGSKFTFPALDGMFPDYRRIIPQVVQSAIPAAYNGQYLADAAKALAIYRNRDPKKAGVLVHPAGNDCAIFTDGEPGAMVLVMPMRLTHDAANNARAVTMSLQWFGSAYPGVSAAA
jgi:hypothetical protein